MVDFWQRSALGSEVFVLLVVEKVFGEGRLWGLKCLVCWWLQEIFRGIFLLKVGSGQ